MFFAVVLTPAVDVLQRRLRLRRGSPPRSCSSPCSLLLAGMLYAFIRPLVDQVSEFADDLPDYVEDAETGEGPVGELVKRYNLEEWVEENQRPAPGRRSAAPARRRSTSLRSVFNGDLRRS